MAKTKIKYVAVVLCCLIFGAAIIIFPERYISDCFAGFSLWAECVLPSLFPFMVITLIMIKTGAAERASLPLRKAALKLKLPPVAGACFLMSACSGYPAGSRILVEFYQNGRLDEAGIRKLSYLCSSSGPLFIIGSVGYKVFADKTIGVRILIAHLVSILTVSIILSLLSKDRPRGEAPPVRANGNALYDAFYGAVIAVLVAGGFIAFFCVVASFLTDFSVLSPITLVLSFVLDEGAAEAVSIGLIEATTGCRALAFECSKINTALAGFLITFGGVSILAQQLSYLTVAKVKAGRFIGVKFLQALLCFALLMIF